MRKLLPLILLLILFLKGYSQIPDSIRGEWVSNKFGYLNVHTNYIDYEYYCYQSKKQSAKETTLSKYFSKRIKSIPAWSIGEQENKLVKAALVSKNGIYNFVPAGDNARDTISLFIKGKDTLLLYNPGYPNTDNILTYTRLKTNNEPLKDDSIIMLLPPPYTGNGVKNSSRYPGYYTYSLVIHNDSAFCLYGKKHVGSALIIDKATYKKLNDAIAHLPDDYAQNYY
jgi:hypothetical protein